MRTENPSKGKENQENQSPEDRPSFLPKTSRSGRTITLTRSKDFMGDDFVYSDPFETTKPRIPLSFLFPNGDVMPHFDQDELNIKSKFSELNGYVSPSKTTVRASVRITTTPRKREFKKVADVTVVREEKRSRFGLFQEPDNYKERVRKYPPVIGNSPSKVNVTPPEKSVKQVWRRITPENIEEAGQTKRLNPKQLFKNRSANDLRKSKSPRKNLKKKYVHSHLDQVGSGGADDREHVIVAPEGHNMKRMPAEYSALKDVEHSREWLDYECTVEVASDQEGKLTHIGKGIEVSIWSRQGESLKIELDTENPELPTRTFDKMVQVAFAAGFRSEESSSAEDEETSSFSR